jgi:PHD/YefM family antitoxin component YafN of YafNO toxin-antitoxin module
MIRYAPNELYSVTDLSRQLGNALSQIRQHSLEKIGILKNNRLEAVIISIEEYEALKRTDQNTPSTQTNSHKNNTDWDEMVGILKGADRLQTDDPRYQAILS